MVAWITRKAEEGQVMGQGHAKRIDNCEKALNHACKMIGTTFCNSLFIVD